MVQRVSWWDQNLADWIDSNIEHWRNSRPSTEQAMAMEQHQAVLRSYMMGYEDGQASSSRMRQVTYEARFTRDNLQMQPAAPMQHMEEKHPTELSTYLQNQEPTTNQQAVEIAAQLENYDRDVESENVEEQAQTYEVSEPEHALENEAEQEREHEYERE